MLFSAGVLVDILDILTMLEVYISNYTATDSVNGRTYRQVTVERHAQLAVVSKTQS